MGVSEFEVFNDAITLPDGTYINVTYDEAKEIAGAWGCQLPNLAQARKIREVAQDIGVVYRAETYLPNDFAQRYSNMTKMMNSQKMHEISRMGRTKLVNGHFKWYIDDGSNAFRFYGFKACRGGSYCQGGGSGGHDKNWIDYSQSARIICKKQ
jgi:hypothetical protein